MPRQITRSAIALLITAFRVLRWLGRFVLAVLGTVVVAPLGLIARCILRPILLRLYRWSFPLRLGLGRLLAPGWRGLLHLLTTRRVAHALIAILTIVISTGSLAAQEIARVSNDQSLLASLVVDEQNETLTSITPRTTDVARAELDALDVSDTALGFAVEPSDGDDVLTAPLLSATTTAGTPRHEVLLYTVKGGDTISGIAATFGVTGSSILWANGLSETDYIKPNQSLTIPPVSGVLHRVKSGETLAGITNKYKANLDAVLEFNQLADASAIEAEQVLMVPGGVIESPRPTYAPTRYANAEPGAGIDTNPPPSVGSRGGGVVWPTGSRRINRGYLAYHRALDIDGNIGSPVYASDDGVVESVSYIRYGYGFHVVINHGGGIKTLYAHNGKIFVRPGQRVNAGQTISTVGMTGYTTGPHLHFEVFVNGVKINPWGYLR